LAINMRPLAAALLLNIIMYNGRVSKTIQIFPNRAKPAQACGQIFPRRTLGFPSVSVSFPELSLFKRLSRPPGEKILSSLLSPPFAFPVASFIRPRDQAITFSDFRKQNLGDFADLGDLSCQERVQNADGSLAPFKPFPPIGHGLSPPARRQPGRPHRATE
jgi:hypothetical protein